MSRWPFRLGVGLTGLLLLAGGTPRTAPANETTTTQDVWATFVIAEGPEVDTLKPAVYENRVVYRTDNY